MPISSPDGFFASLRRNSVALMSLCIAIVALTQNTIRAERTEDNRNTRYAAFEILREATKLQLLIDHAHYDVGSREGNPIVGWGHVQYMQDLSLLLPTDIGEQTGRLKGVWHDRFSDLGSGDRDSSLSANEALTAEINALRQDLKQTLLALE